MSSHDVRPVAADRQRNNGLRIRHAKLAIYVPS
jgi:hypothetical protein